MARAVNRTLLWALAVSLLLHFLMLGSVGRFWTIPPARVDIPIDVRLVPPAPKPEPVKPPVPRPGHKRIHPARPVEPPRPRPQEPTIRPEPVVRPPPAPAPVQERATPQATAPEALVVPTAGLPANIGASKQEPPGPPIRSALRDLPSDLVINYAVQIGDGDNGFVAGRAAYIWHSGQGKYSMVSTIQATGLVALFVTGRIVQLSEGRITAEGLRPEQYWLERGGRKQDSARFNWAANQLVLGGDQAGRPLREQAQDLLSFPFQLAMTARADEPDFVLWVTNGRNFRDYDFHVVGPETINLPQGQAETLHLQGTRVGEGTLDVWLDLAQSGLPVRIRTRDQEGKTMMLRLEGISTRGANAPAGTDSSRG